MGAAVGLWNAGGHNKKDNIPAMLMGGEYVINADAVNRYGVDFFKNLNKGKLNKYADGGLVGESSAPAGNSFDTDLGSGVTNNVTVNVNIEKGGSVTTSTGGMSAEEGRGLANIIKDQVIRVIVNEKRQGGILHS